MKKFYHVRKHYILGVFAHIDGKEVFYREIEAERKPRNRSYQRGEDFYFRTEQEAQDKIKELASQGFELKECRYWY